MRRYSFFPKSQKRRGRHGRARIQLFPKKVRAAGRHGRAWIQPLPKKSKAAGRSHWIRGQGRGEHKVRRRIIPIRRPLFRGVFYLTFRWFRKVLFVDRTYTFSTESISFLLVETPWSLKGIFLSLLRSAKLVSLLSHSIGEIFPYFSSPEFKVRMDFLFRFKVLFTFRHQKFKCQLLWSRSDTLSFAISNPRNEWSFLGFRFPYCFRTRNGRL